VVAVSLLASLGGNFFAIHSTNLADSTLTVGPILRIIRLGQGMEGRGNRWFALANRVTGARCPTRPRDGPVAPRDAAGQHGGTTNVSDRRGKRWLGVVLETTGAPLIWGTALSVVYFVALRQGVFQSPLLLRYTAGHPVEYVETGLFFVGMVAILLRGWQAAGELRLTDSVDLPAPAAGNLPAAVAVRAATLLEQIKEWPASVRRLLVSRRLQDGLSHLVRSDAADRLDEELKYLADIEVEKNHDGYALARIVIWATPMLGFLGTVIGITEALAGLSPEALVNSPKEAMDGLLSGLGVAFDTTALALTLSMVMMFAQFLTQQIEGQVLAMVDRNATRILSTHFVRHEVSADPQAAVLHRIAQSTLSAVDVQTQRQAEIWRHTLEQSHQQWSRLIQNTGQAMEASLAGALQKSLDAHHANLLRVEQHAGEFVGSQWAQWQKTAEESLRQLQTQQAEVGRQSEILLKVLDATGQVISLEKALNQNLRALAGAKNFEDTVMSLSAAIHLLSTRLGKPMPRDAQVQLEVSTPQERAA
jgi:biopolymer transport protein ExbB/TolQ